VADLWVLVPSRGRPQNVDRLVRACALTCRADTRLHFGFDEDDPAREPSIAATGGHRYTVAPRMGLTAWTNVLASRHMDVPALGSLGDDHLPITDGWDEQLLESLPGGGGYAYPNDLRRDDIPEAVVVSTSVVAALGWFALPALSHWYIDNVWRDLGHPDRLVYRPDVIVRHMHPAVVKGVPGDATYSEAAAGLNADLAVYQRWRLSGMARDRAAIREGVGGTGDRAAGGPAAGGVAGSGG
jgi:hypothetical protein